MADNQSKGFVGKLSSFVVDKRGIFFLIYVFALAFCVFSMSWVQVENDVVTYLPEDTETRQGIDAMNENFVMFGTAQVMVSNITYEVAQDIYEELSAIEGISMVVFDDSPDHYIHASALYDLNFAGGNFDEISLDALAETERILEGYDVSIYTAVGQDMNEMLDDEMGTIFVVAVVLILLVLTLTSRAYMEVPVLLITFGAAALLNMGTNFIFGKISFISDSVAVVLQLALALDYAIILCHRFSDEHETLGARDAAVEALRKSIPEISASSLTTISGLAALGFMKFKIGLDMSVVLMKSILLSLLSVFTLMPGLLVLFSPLIDRTRHKKLLPDVSFLGKFAVKTRRVIPVIFVLLLGGAFWLSSNCPYAYSFTDLKTAKMTESQHAYFRIKDTFGTSNMVALLVPGGDYEAEARVLEDLSQCPEVKSTMGLAGIEAMEGYKLTDKLDPREMSELIGMDYEVIQLLYAAYAAEEEQFGAIITGLDEYEIPLFDMFIFLKDQLEELNIDLSSGDQAMIGELFGALDAARSQLQSEDYSRMVVYLNVPEEGEETYAFLAQIREIVGRYYKDDYYVVGNSTSSRDLAAAFSGDNLLISTLSTFFVILVLLFTFRSAGLPVLLIIVIQGSIWINFSFPSITGVPLFPAQLCAAALLFLAAAAAYAMMLRRQDMLAYLAAAGFTPFAYYVGALFCDPVNGIAQAPVMAGVSLAWAIYWLAAMRGTPEKNDGDDEG